MKGVVAAVVFLGTLSVAWGGERSSCRGCHPPHYVREGGCTSCHRGDDRTNRRELAHREMLAGAVASYRLPDSPPRERGKRLVALLGCRRCHRVGGEGNRLAAELDVSSRKPLSRLRGGIDHPSPFMPRFRLTPADRDAIVAFILASGVGSAPSGPNPPQVVHFSPVSAGVDPFSRRCGGCHRILTARRGGMGRGEVAPNLSGLFTPYYPRREGIGTFDGARLLRWVKNPRSVTPAALMPPIVLTEGEQRWIVDLFRDDGSP